MTQYPSISWKPITKQEVPARANRAADGMWSSMVDEFWGSEHEAAEIYSGERKPEYVQSQLASTIKRRGYEMRSRRHGDTVYLIKD